MHNRLLKIVLAVLLIFNAEKSIYAASYIWSGANSSDWYDSGNWSPSGVPGAGDDVTINTGFAQIGIGSVGVSGLTISGGTLQVSSGASLALNGTNVVSGGTLDIGGTLTLSSNLDVGGNLIVLGNITGGSDLIISGTMTWNSTSSIVDVSGQFMNNGTINVAGGGQLQANLINSATINITGNFLFGNNSNLINLGTIDFQGNGDIPYNSLNNGGIMNQGLVKKSGGSSTSDISVDLDNNGSIDGQVGTLRLSGNGNHGGDFISTSPGYVSLSGIADTLAGGNSFGGSGSCSIDGSNVFLMANCSATNLKITQGSISGDGDFTASGAFEWLGGDLGDAAHPTGQINLNGTFLIAGGDKLEGELTNNANTTWSSGSWIMGDLALFRNNSTMNIQTNSDISVSGSPSNFYNHGFITKSAGTSITEFNIHIFNTGTITVQVGEIRFQDGGYNSGDIFISAGASVDVPGGDQFVNAETGGIEGHGDFNFSGNLVNNGVFRPGSSPGILTFNKFGAGTISISDTTVFEMEIGGILLGTEYDHIIFNALVTIDGALNIELIGGFTPVVNDTFILIDYTSLSGWFYEGITACTGVDSLEFKIIDTGSEIIATVISIIPPPTIVSTICQGDSLQVYGAFQNTSGIYYDSLQTVFGCDSVLSHQLIVNPTYNLVIPSTTICEDDSTLIFGTYQNTAGMYYDSLQTIMGCDSISSKQLIVNLLYNQNENTSICSGNTYIFPDGGSSSIDSVHTSMLTTTNGCDSLITTTLIVQNIDTTVTQSGITLTSNTTGATYQWVDCNNGFSAINGETNQSYTPIDDGNYAVIITQNSCSDTSACSSITGVGITYFGGNIHFEIYPNPIQGELSLNLEGDLPMKNLFISITNTSGQVIYTKQIQNIGSTYQSKISLQNESAGVYFIKLTTEDYTVSKKIILQ
jgi:hypothetical protein